MDAKVNWQGRLTFTGTAGSGFSLPLGSSHKVGGDNDGFFPMELFAIGLAGCTAMDVISILTKKREQITDFEVKTHVERTQEHPKVFTSAIIEYHVTGHNVKPSAVFRSIELSAVRYCPAQAMLSQIIPIELKYFIYKDMGNGEKEFEKSGGFMSSELTALP